MKEEKDYIRDIAEIRSIMERSSKFLSLAGWAGIMAGIYALCGAYIAYSILHFNPDEIVYSVNSSDALSFNLWNVVLFALGILILASATAAFLSYKKADKHGEKLWNPTSKRLLISMSIPFLAGVFIILIFISKGLLGLIAPFTLLFYGLALYNAGKFTYNEVKILGLIEIALGIVGCYFVEYGLLLWALGFGAVHIVYGIYMHYKYER